MGTSLPQERSDRAGWRQAAAAVCGLALLVGCQNVGNDVAQFYDSKLTLDRPVDWWHQLQGGPIAAARPPPPGITDPYANFSKLPPRPAPVDFASKRALVSQMTTDRDRTTRINQQDPIVFSSSNAAPKPSAAKPGSTATAAPPASAAPPAPDADTSRLSFDAADATPATTPQAAVPANDPHPPAALAAVRGAEAPVVSGPIPAIPQAAPPLPQLPGLPTTERVPVVPRPIPTARISFAKGSATLPQDAEVALTALVARRSGAPIAIVAGGEARSPSPTAQREALPLALRRTAAITAALVAAGVPAGDIRAEAMAQGRDASAQLLR